MGEGSSEHHFEGRHDLAKEDKKMICKKVCKACHEDYKQAGLSERESGSKGRRGWAISWRKPLEEGPQR